MSAGRFLDSLILQVYAKGEGALAAGVIYTAPRYFITDQASTQCKGPANTPSGPRH